MYRLKFFIDFEKEEQWLNQMAKNGYHLQSTSFGYHFQRGKAENAIIKIDFRKFKKKEDFIDYCTLFEDSGWKHLAGTKNSGIQYFQKVDSSYEDDIFSDAYSKASRYKRYANTFFELAISFIPLLIVFYLTDIIDPKALINPKELYLTPGLWAKTGTSFWFSFLFETPFALMRGIAWSFIPVTIILYLFFGYKSNKLYLQNRE
ncbi:uncharacterized protein DUF2812 [Ureibacillus xyleni]|uniref:Uncharacterized protein DUF2812 n=1 Tax=Ureibacillus xyleni TaxID=614648 RepID=A0A285TQ33_9BACL|nr:DUF2812 domain-containing protein [Ureibacillus xyleni]SOC25179.1 uncharacterized protein DUF2812 [Ureibacillus xyleni]